MREGLKHEPRPELLIQRGGPVRNSPAELTRVVSFVQGVLATAPECRVYNGWWVPLFLAMQPVRGVREDRNCSYTASLLIHPSVLSTVQVPSGTLEDQNGMGMLLNSLRRQQSAF